MKHHNLVHYAGDSAYCSNCRQWLNDDLQQLGCAVTPLISLSTLSEAIEVKFKRGALEHRQGRSEFVGDPLTELFEEYLDIISYCDEAMSRGINLSHRKREATAAALEIRSLWRAH